MWWSLSSQKLNCLSELVREPNIVGFFTLQYAKLRIPELYYNFFDKYCDVTEFVKMEKDTDSRNLAFSGKDLYDCIRPTMNQKCNSL